MSRRKHSKIDKLPPDIKDTVEDMIRSDFTYSEIADYAIHNDIIESISSQGFSTTFTKNKIFILGLPIWKEMYYNGFRCSFNIFLFN